MVGWSDLFLSANPESRGFFIGCKLFVAWYPTAMHVKRLEVQGFKTFAQKTTFLFIEPKSGQGGLTVIVGPNGSGKSNAADAIRWVMGEQSVRLLRGKASEDVIFSGSGSRARSGFAEVTMVLENDSHPEIAFEEIALTRRLDRDGRSEYEINGEAAKLSEVSLLLAQIGIAQRSYAVIGQGMVDQVLSASPSERKVFFDEAFGVRPFQLRREQALRRIDEAKRNVEQSRTLLNELLPRLETLRKQVARRDERASMEQELAALEERWYGAEWRRLRHEAGQAERTARAIAEEERVITDRLSALPPVTIQVSAGEPPEVRVLREQIAGWSREQRALQDERSHLQTELAVRKAKAERAWSPLPLSKIVERVQRIFQDLRFLSEGSSSLEAGELSARLRASRDALASLLADLERPAPDVTRPVDDADIDEAMARLVPCEQQLATQIRAADAEIQRIQQAERTAQSSQLEAERLRTQLERDRFTLERRRSDSAVALARVDERRSALLEEVARMAPSVQNRLEDLAQRAGEAVDPSTPAKLHRLRTQLEWVGSIPEETVLEFEQTRERVEYMQAQLTDIEASLQDLDAVVAELDGTISARRTSAFSALNQAFGAAAEELFGGGEAKLVEVQAEPEIDSETGEVLAPADPHAGIDILATPPGKRLKAVSLLSGGERALVSIALICAIMATNPSPFVVLDEVDAALDEANAKRFGEMLARMAQRIQCIVVTHNRTTMSHADAIYGVTMGEDGVSRILSMKLEEGTNTPVLAEEI